MKPRPFYRWKSFWLGLFVLVFFGWAWWDSYRIDSAITLSWRSRLFGCTCSEGVTCLYWVDYGGIGTERPIKYLRDEGLALALNDFLMSLGGRRFRLPDAFVFFSCLGLWFGWLVCHSEWEQRKLTA